MIIRILAISLSGIVLGLLQSTLISQIIPFDFVPDIALIFIIAASWRYGSIPGEISGFLIGLSFDVMGLAPIGFHAFLFTVIAYLFGRLQGNIAPGPFAFPALAALAATLMKYGGSLLLSLVFGLNSVSLKDFTLGTLWEALANALIAPLVFLAFHALSRLVEGRKGGF